MADDDTVNPGEQVKRAAGDVTTSPNAESGLQSRIDQEAGRLVVGAPIFDRTGEKVGEVSALNARNDYFTLEKGILFPRDFYVPLSAVERLGPDGVYLNVDKDQMAYLGWDAKPVDSHDDDASSLSVADQQQDTEDHQP
jgi:hypothetical protein